jgi:hypothetical protein
VARQCARRPGLLVTDDVHILHPDALAALQIDSVIAEALESYIFGGP